ncbi:MAG: GWxTD domain-containing protein [Acidobacteriota bacterium]
MKSTFCFLVFVLAFTPISAQKKPDDIEKYFKKWLNEDVVYILAPEERDVFQKLQTVEEKEGFIEQFWLRRDPDPSTAVNEFKEEHYRRLAYVSDNFHSGAPGWKTDRGRVYIRFGPPDSIQKFGPGETYVRPDSEGAGITKTFAFQIWHYRDIEGVGQDIDLEFVDTSMTNEYKLTTDSNDKDMLFYSGGGKTAYEEAGLESRWMRNTRRGLATTYRGHVKDLPFEKLALLGRVDRPPPVRFEKLRTVVTTRISYAQFPVRVRADHVRAGPDSVITLLNLQVDQKDLVAPGHKAAGELQIYGRLMDIKGRVIHEFDASVQPDAGTGQGALFYQKPLTLPPGVYKLDLVVNDEANRRMATREERIEVPATVEALSASSLILAEDIQPVEELSDPPRPFELGELRVIPRLDSRFGRDERMKLYFQIYGFQADPESQQPGFSLKYFVMKDGKQVRSFADPTGASLQTSSAQRAVFVSAINLRLLEPGKYRLLVRISDKVSNTDTSTSAEFEVIG